MFFKNSKNKFGLCYKLLYFRRPKAKNDHETNCANIVFSAP